MSTLTNTQKVLGGVAVLLMASVGAYGALFMKIRSLHAEADALRAVVYQEVVRTEEAQRMSTLVQDTVDERTELYGHLLAIDNPSPFLSLIEALGSDAGVALSVESLSEVVPPAVKAAPKGKQAQTPQEPPGKKVNATVSVEGTFAEVYHLLMLLERMPYTTSLKQVSMQRKSETSLWDGTVQVVVNARSVK